PRLLSDALPDLRGRVGRLVAPVHRHPRDLRSVAGEKNGRSVGLDHGVRRPECGSVGVRAARTARDARGDHGTDRRLCGRVRYRLDPRSVQAPLDRAPLGIGSDGATRAASSSGGGEDARRRDHAIVYVVTPTPTSGRPSNRRAATAPKMKPPTWAAYATPPAGCWAPAPRLTNCVRNQTPIRSAAGMYVTFTKTKITRSERILSRG